MSKKSRACDRCHRYKEKCSFETDASSCILCRQSALPCTTTRTQRRRGRRPTAKLLGPDTWIHLWEAGNDPEDIDRSLVENTNQLSLPLATNGSGTHSSPTLQDPFDSSPDILERFAIKYDLFMIGPSFALGFRVALQHAYYCAPLLLQDIFTVVFTALKYGEHYTSMWQQLNTTKGAASLQTLRTVEVTNIQDAFAVVALGQSLAAFELLTNCTSSISILRYSLSLVNPWYRELSSDSSFDPVVTGSIFWDTVSCLVRREVPIMRFCCRDPQMIDHSAGLCTTLLPILFDLCLAGNESKRGLGKGEQIDTSSVKRVEQMLLAWSPEASRSLAPNFTHQEALAMMSQANMYQTAGLLVAHRIVNPLGVFDDVAAHYANAILTEFSTFSALAGSDTTMPFVAFPITMAAFEVPTVPACIWERITMLAAAPVCAAKLLNIVDYVWAERRAGFGGSIFELVELGPDFIIVP